MEMWILVTEENSAYHNKILQIRQEYHNQIHDGAVVWFIYSVNGEDREFPDWFEEYELKELKYLLVDEKSLNLLAFI